LLFVQRSGKLSLHP